MSYTFQRLIPSSIVAFALLLSPGVQAKKKCNAKQKSGDIWAWSTGDYE